MKYFTGRLMNTFIPYLAICLAFTMGSTTVSAQTDLDHMGRGIVAVSDGSTGIYLGWRLFGDDPEDVAFNLYRITDGAAAVKINDTPLMGATNYVDAAAVGSTHEYFVVPVLNDVEQASSDTVAVWNQNYLTVPLQRPAGGTGPDGVNYTYAPNDASVADLDGDGELEIVLKWSPSNAKDNAHGGNSGNMILDAYELDGSRLWSIDFGINVRSGAHYGPFMVYDLDGDGTAELVARTAPGSKDGSGEYLSKGAAASANHSADYRNSGGYILTGPEYLTVFKGADGSELETIDLEPDRGNVNDWGDSYGNRVDRFLAAVLYLDGVNPSVVWCRGIYTKVEIAAYQWDGSSLSQQWIFKSQQGYTDWTGMGSHNLSVGDVDADGRDEIVYGHCAIDDDGKGLWSLKSQIGTSTGDAMHLADMLPERPGLERWACGEYSNSGSHLVDAGTGEVIWKTPAGDVGRAAAADLVEEFYGMEVWGGTNGLRSATNAYAGPWPSSTNHVVWWDADLGRELLNGNYIDKYGQGRILTASGCSSNNGSKSNPSLQADIFGDWREEVIWRTDDNNNLRIYTTTDLTEYGIKTLMHDRQYRLAVAWQNNSYNQPPHTSFYLGYDMFIPAEDIPPSSPIGLDVDVNKEFFKLSWTENIEGDIAGYHMYKSTSGGNFERLNEELIPSTILRDSTFLLDIIYKYKVTAVDLDGNESPASLTVNALATYKPDAPENIKTSMGAKKALIYWDPVMNESGAKKTALLEGRGTKSMPAADLTLRHAYTFADGTATDTVAGADGTVISGEVIDGAFVANADGEYIQLPAATIAINTYSSITVEAYIVADLDNTEATMLSYFGGNVNGYGGDGFFLTPDRWTESRTAISCGNLTQPWTAEQGVTGDPVTVGEQHHLVSVLTDTSISLYIDGNLIGTSAVSGTNSIANLSNANAWICKGGYNSDPTWMGTVHEFNIYEGIMDEAAVIARSVSFPHDTDGPVKGEIIGYNLYVTETSGSGYTKINTDPMTETKYIHENLENGKDYYYLVTSVDDSFRESYYPDEISVKPGNTVILQAEDAAYFNTYIESNHTGFNGTGFANFEASGNVQFNYVFSKDHEWYKLITRYALGADDPRAGTIEVNDSLINYTMAGTGGWTNFKYDTIIVRLNKGFDNTIRFEATGNDFGNLDEIIIGIKAEAPNPDGIRKDLIQSLNAYPNPFNSMTNIDLRYEGTSMPGIRIFNMYGQEVKRDPFERIGDDLLRYQWDGRGEGNSALSPGIYFATVHHDGSGYLTIKLVLKN